MPTAFAVATTGSDTSGTGSANAPFHSIQKAANVAAAGDTILVAGGSYTYDPSQDTISIQQLATKQVVTIFNKVLNISGGFTTADGFAASNPQANPTVIDGQNAVRGLQIVGFDKPTGGTIQGVIFRNGLGTPLTVGSSVDRTFAFGGGAFVNMGSRQSDTTPITFRDVTFENNRSVGLAGITSDPANDFGGAGSGAGLELRYANNVRLQNVAFRNNVSQGGSGAIRGGVALGGGLHMDHSTATADGLLFDGNQAIAGSANGPNASGVPTTAGNQFAADGTGGGAAIQNGSSLDASNVTVTNNRAQGGNADGNAGDAYGGGVFTEAASVAFRNAIFSGNVARGGVGDDGSAGGGAIQTTLSNLTLDRVKVINNTAAANNVSTTGGTGEYGAVSGGGINSTNIGNATALTVTISNSVIADNTAAVGSNATAGVGGAGGALWLQGVTATVSHTTIADNVLDPKLVFGEAIILLNDGVQTPTVLNLNYSTITGHDQPASEVTLFRGTTLNLNRNLFNNRSSNGATKTETLGGGPVTSPGVVNGSDTTLNAAPLYTSAGSPNFDYSLTANSPAVNAATGSTEGVDIGQAARTGVPDLGAYELGTPGSAPTVPAAAGAAVTAGPPGGGLVAGGFSPLLVGTTQFAAGADAGGTTATLYNADGSVRYTVTPFPGFTGGVRTATADFNRDGVADLIAGTGPGVGTLVRVFDGATQAVLFQVQPFEATFTGGVYVAAGDTNGDGLPDLAITPDQGGGPRVDVYSGAGFGKLTSFFGIDDPNFRGGARATIADFTGDGIGDVIVVAGFGGGPRVAGYDGTTITGTPTKIFPDFFAFEQTLRNGIFVAAGDVNGDGVADLIAGGGPGGGPRVTVFDGNSVRGNNPTAIGNFFAGDTNNRGGVRVAVKDLDGDNRADVVVGSGTGAGSRLTAYLGKNIAAAGTPTPQFDFDAIAGFGGGVFVG